MPLSTLTLQNTINFALPYVQFRPLAIGSSNEPAITIANTVMQTIFAPPFTWWFNRWEQGLLLEPGRQDYALIVWSPGIGVPAGWLYNDVNGNQQVATVGGTTGTTYPTWNTSVGGTTTDGSVTWTNAGSTSAYGSAPPTKPMGWIEGGTIIDSNGVPHELTCKSILQVESGQSLPLFVSLFSGVSPFDAYSIRFFMVPDQDYTVYLTCQLQPPLFTSLSQLWYPIPDNYSYVYQFGFLALAMAYADDPRFMQFSQMFKGHLLGASTGLDETQKNLFMERWDRTVANSQGIGLRTQQGVQARAL